jgi:uncharacterized membrane protein
MVHIVELKLYFLTLVIFLSIDSFWLGLMVPKFYQSQTGYLMTETSNLPAASLYICLLSGRWRFCRGISCR